MKKYTFILIWVLLFAKSYGQCICDDPNSPACNGIISTDPNNPVNTERPSMRNTFDWRTSPWKVYHPDANASGIFDENGLPKDKPSPFFGIDPGLGFINFYHLPSEHNGNSVYLDFHPKDGWELLYKRNGINLDGTTVPIGENRRGPLFILYNRYTGKIRILAALPVNSPQGFLTTIKFREISTLKVSGLLGKYTERIRALDKKTVAKEAVETSHGVLENDFFISEFSTNYDPCTCNNRSELNIEFAITEKATLKASGRLIGTNVPLDNSGNSPLLNGGDFLASVYKEGFDVQGGLVTYANIDKLVQQYEGVGETDPFKKLALKGLGILLEAAGVKGGSLAANLIFDKLSTGDNSSITLANNTISRDQFKNALGELGKNAKQLSTKIFPTGGTVPNITFIEAELALSGEIKTVINTGSGSERIATPGSKLSGDPTIIQDRFYPLYNEALGVFTLLETPKVIWHGYREVREIGIKTDIYHQLDKNPIKYYFNPAAEINLDKVKIYGALVIKAKYCFVDLNEVYSGLTHHLNLISSNSDFSKQTFITDFYPIEVLHRVAPRIIALNRTYLPNSDTQNYDICQTEEISLRLQIFYQTKKNKYGKVHTNYEILTYETDITNVSLDGPPPQHTLEEFPRNITVYGTSYVYSTQQTCEDAPTGDPDEPQEPTPGTPATGAQPEDKFPNGPCTETTTRQHILRTSIGDYRTNEDITLRAYDNIIITGDITDLPSGTEVTLIAGKKIIVKRGVTLERDVKLRRPFNNIWGIPRIPPVSPSYVRNFCASSSQAGPSYRANTSARIGDFEEPELSKNTTQKQEKYIHIYPNPTNGLIKIAFYFPEVENLQINVYNAMGIVVYQTNLQGITQETYSINLDDRPRGMYFINIQTSTEHYREKILLIK